MLTLSSFLLREPSNSFFVARADLVRHCGERITFMLFIASAKVHASFDLQTERHATVDLNQATRAPDARRG